MTLINDDEFKTAIGKLLVSACPLSKKVISSFDFKASRTSNIKALSKFKLDMLEPCAEFLNLKLADPENNKIYTKDALVSRILLAIEALLPATCVECSNTYCVEFDSEESPAFTCFMCFQGSHNCQAIQAVHEALSSVTLATGNVWLCSKCHTKSNPVNPRKVKSRHVSISEPPSRDPIPDQTSSGAIDQVELEERLQHVARTRVCEKYLNGKCQHGLKGNKAVNGEVCKFNHPKRCFKFCGFGNKGVKGCKKGDECSYFHPTLCKHSVQKRCCTNDSCTFVHLKGTSRKANVPPRLENPSSSEKGKTKLGPKNKKELAVVEPERSKDFLELQELIKHMGSTFQQEISLIKISLQQHQQPVKYFSPVQSPVTMIPPQFQQISPTQPGQFHPTYIHQ